VLWCVVIDIAGNLLFMGASCGSRTYFGGLVLITGRLMAGAAAGVIIIGLSFVTQVNGHTHTHSHRLVQRYLCSALMWLFSFSFSFSVLLCY